MAGTYRQKGRRTLSEVERVLCDAVGSTIYVGTPEDAAQVISAW